LCSLGFFCREDISFEDYTFLGILAWSVERAFNDSPEDRMVSALAQSESILSSQSSELGGGWRLH
jgi:hypothetical protein